MGKARKRLGRAKRKVVRAVRHAVGGEAKKPNAQPTPQPHAKAQGQSNVMRGTRPLVAIWRPDLNPTPLAKALAMMGESQGIDVIYICTYGMNLKKELLVGKMLKPGTDQWERRVTRMPDIVDTSGFCWTHTAAVDYFEEHCWCTNLRRNNMHKSKLQELLVKDERVARYAIPTLRYRTAEELEAFVREHGDAVAKPIRSSRGRGVHRVTFERERNMFRVGYLTEEEEFAPEEFRAYANEHLMAVPHIAQRYVSSRTRAGDPFDCRVHVEKNGSGEWEPASMLVRIGIGQKVISNINQGGGMAELEPFLRANRPDCMGAVLEGLGRLARVVPSWYEERRGVEVCTLGIDTAITEEGDLYIFEINGLPFVDFDIGQTAMLRSAYFRWVAEHRLGMKN